MDNRKHQVFLSSTFRDLQEERMQTLLALLETDCIPVGMELFPASDKAAWEYIRRVIDQCDYYLVILAGRYGTINEDSGLSFTELEFDYAQKIGKPTLVFYHENPSDLPGCDRDDDPKLRKKLESFRTKALKRLSRSYTEPLGLKGSVISAINSQKKVGPTGGWVPASMLPPADVMEQIRQLETEKATLQKRLDDTRAGRASQHAIEVFLNHVAAQPKMDEVIAEAVRSSESTEIQVFAVSLKFSWPFLRNAIGKLLGSTPEFKTIDLELLMLAPSYLNSIGLVDWAKNGEDVQRSVRESCENDEIANFVRTGRLNIRLGEYRNLHPWHGMLVNGNSLFLGRTKPILDQGGRDFDLSVGEEVYRQFASHDTFEGSDRVDLFQRWAKYYGSTGRWVFTTEKPESES